MPSPGQRQSKPPTNKPSLASKLSQVSPKAINSFAVHQLSARPGRLAGAQRTREWKDVEPLPAKYKPAARRITAAMVAAPIAIVTSYFLYQRLVLGNERKVMPHETPVKVLPGPQGESAEDQK